MIQFCMKCGKKVTGFSRTPLELMDGELLCNDCAEPIQAGITKLYGAKTIEDFNNIKLDIMEISRNTYDESTCALINNLICKILVESSYIHSDDLTEDDIPVTTVTPQDMNMMTTGYDFEGYKIKKYMGVVSGQTVLGTGFLSEFTASFSDFFGVQSKKFARKLEQAKLSAVKKMVAKSKVRGGNAIIGVDFDYMTFHSNVIGIVANGTSVVIEECDL